MLDGIRAELLKLRHHNATWLLVWIYPLTVGLLTIVLIGRDAAGIDPGPVLAAEDWTRQSANIWTAPTSAGGRFLIGCFAAVAFAGEYGWNTWKLVIPARPRGQLLTIKLVVVLLLLLCGLAAADAIGLIGTMMRSVLGGPPIAAGADLIEVLRVHLRAATTAVLPIVYTVVITSLFCVLTQSLFASVVLSAALVLIGQMLPGFAPIGYSYFPEATSIMLRITPFYHLLNVTGAAESPSLMLPLAEGVVFSMTSVASTIVLLCWTAATGTLALACFRNQDLN